MDVSVSVKNTLQKVSSNAMGNISYELMCPITGHYLVEIIIGLIAGWIGILALLYAGEYLIHKDNNSSDTGIFQLLPLDTVPLDRND